MTYQSRSRVPNVSTTSNYIANLNSINPSQSSPESFDDSFGHNPAADNSLDLFASTQFFDFDMGTDNNDGANNEATGRIDNNSGREGSGVKEENLDFLMNGWSSYSLLLYPTLQIQSRPGYRYSLAQKGNEIRGIRIERERRSGTTNQFDHYKEDI